MSVTLSVQFNWNMGAIKCGCSSHRPAPTSPTSPRKDALLSTRRDSFLSQYSTIFFCSFSHTIHCICVSTEFCSAWDLEAGRQYNCVPDTRCAALVIIFLVFLMALLVQVCVYTNHDIEGGFVWLPFLTSKRQ